MKYYFVSYQYSQESSFGFGRCFYRTKGCFVIKEIEKWLTEQDNKSKNVVLNIQRISKKEFEANT